MNLTSSTNFLTEVYKKSNLNHPSLYLVLGSGLASALKEESLGQKWQLRLSLPFTDLPGIPPATVDGHRGLIQYYEHSETKKCLAIQMGRIHGYEGHSPMQVVHTVMAAFLAGTTHFILTNAAGGLCDQYEIGSLMIIKDHFNFTGQNPLVGSNPVNSSGKPIGDRFPDMSEIYDRSTRMRLKNHFITNEIKAFEGNYLGLLGPSFETPFEISVFSQWGAHAVGMSTIWEAIALKHAGATLAGISLISNLACGLGEEKEINHEENLEKCSISAQKNLKSILSFAENELIK